MTDIITIKPARKSAMAFNAAAVAVKRANRKADAAQRAAEKYKALGGIYKMSKADREAALQAGREWAAQQAAKLAQRQAAK